MSHENVHEDSEKGSSREFKDHLDLAYNVNAKIQNPLHGISHDKLLAQVHSFAHEHDMKDILGHLQKGALLAQNPGKVESIKELDESDLEVIRREKTHKWSQPRDLYLTVIICSLAAAVQGWDQTGSNGANLSFPQEFNISTDASNPNASTNEWIVGVINAAPYISASLLGCWLTDPLNNFFGRRGTIFICGIFCTLSVIGAGCAQTWPQLFVCRLLLGIGMGAKASTVPVYAAENTPANIRGGLVMSWQMWVCTSSASFISVSLTVSTDSVRYFPRLLCEPGSLSSRVHCLAITTRFCFHSCCSPCYWNLFLPRISKMAYEERSLQSGLQLFQAPSQL